MLKSVEVARLKPNPFRRLHEYPIIREKVDALKDSIAQTGFWGNIVGRPNGDDIEIAYGHHRLVALQEAIGDGELIEVIVRDLSNEHMLQMMANENMEEWGTSAWVELETLRAVIEAYGRGEIELPKVPRDTPKQHVRRLPHATGERSYTISTVAAFLGWTRRHKSDLQPNYACETAFKAIDMIDAGFLSESDLKGLRRSHLANLVKEQWAIYQAEMRVAKQNEEDARRARERAATIDSPVERQRHEKRAAVHDEQAETHKEEAKRKATAFGKEGAGMFRDDRGREAVKARAAELKPTVARPSKVLQIDDLADRIAKLLEAIADGDDALSEDFKFLKANLSDISERSAIGLRRSFAALIARLERMQEAITTKGSHADGTRSSHARRSLNGSRN